MARTIITGASYHTSAICKDQYPLEKLPEIAFIGRSNVGKSTMINSLLNRRGLAHTSKTPGKTQMLNFFLVGAKVEGVEMRQDFFLVDLPGYGYAQASKSDRANWVKFIEEYLLTSEQLRFVCQLIDSRHEPMASDCRMFRWLVDNGIPVLVIATKIDKLNQTEKAETVTRIKRGLGVNEMDVLPYSSLKGIGREDLLGAIGDVLLEKGRRNRARSEE